MRKLVVVLCGCLFLLGAVNLTLEASSPYMGQSVLDQSAVSARYNLASGDISNNQILFASDETGLMNEAPDGTKEFKYRSPGKAFVLSMILPGLGQFYNGSKIKPVIFLSAEITSWVLYFKWHGQGDDLTDEFEAFNRTHWSEQDYSDFLLAAYGESDDENITGVTEINHHLPDTHTQQFYEMTGKYDQFSWGWDDAQLHDSTLDDFLASVDGPHPVNTSEYVPYSSNRFLYEDMRNNANNKYDDARKMVYVSIVNRLISSFEAMFAAKKHNQKDTGQTSDSFSSLSLNAKFKSYYESMDTPYVTLKIRFK